MPSLAEMMVGQAMHDASPDNAPDIAGNFAKGAAIAQRQQEITMQRQQIDDAHQQLQAAKVEKYMDAIEKAQKYSGKAQTQYINNYLPAYAKALQIDNLFPPDAMKFNMSTPEGIGKMQSLIVDTRANPANASANLAKLNDPEQFADVPVDQRQAMFPNILKAQDEGLKDAATVGKQTTQLNFEAQKDLQTYKTHVADKANSELKPIVEEKVHINSAVDAISRIDAAVAAGKQPSRQDVTLAATGLATTVAKRINPTEFENIMHLPGAENWTIDHWNKYLAGGVNPNIVKGLRSAITDTASQVDQSLNATRKSIEAEVGNSQYASQRDKILAPVSAMIGAIPQPHKKKAGTGSTPPPAGAKISVGGHDMTVDQAKAFLVQYPTDPAASEIKRQLPSE